MCFELDPACLLPPSRLPELVCLASLRRVFRFNAMSCGGIRVLCSILKSNSNFFHDLESSSSLLTTICLYSWRAAWNFSVFQKWLQPSLGGLSRKALVLGILLRRCFVQSTSFLLDVLVSSVSCILPRSFCRLAGCSGTTVPWVIWRDGLEVDIWSVDMVEETCMQKPFLLFLNCGMFSQSDPQPCVSVAGSWFGHKWETAKSFV
jgi:hypothetical protein